MRNIILIISFLLISNIPINSMATCSYMQQYNCKAIIDEIRSCLNKEYNHELENLSIHFEYINDVFNVYWSDPGYVDGPSIKVDSNFCIIKFNTTTYNDDNSVRYVGNYVYYMPLSDSKVLFVRNNYHGKGYHGSSFVMHKDENSTEYEELQPPLVRTKSSMDLELEKNIKN